jgi:NADH pyrophosphatase NudC (nudix superfamily)
VLNQPAGHLEPGETLHDAVVRETLEETAWHVRPIGWIGSYQWQAPGQPGVREGRHYLRVAFAAEALAHEPARPLDTGIERAVWLTPEALRAEHARHRSPLVWRVVEDYLAGQCFPLSAVAAL